ncbi:MAG TPA: class I SAM-dependent methyltransferase [Gammaproteobacteria bacterium]|nr:class I SAM-dependent methyltransferase [Gammaproteobacteria bacterium]
MTRQTAHAVNDDSQEAVGPNCRFCGAHCTQLFVDLGLSPLCQTQIPPERLDHGESFYPLRVFVCGECFLVQLAEYVSREVIFGADYPYFSSYSSSWVTHAKNYVEAMLADHGISRDSFVVEVASNDGYLLQHFVKAGVPCLGIEPAHGVADAARANGIETVSRFFGRQTAAEVAAEYGKADLVLGNNVLAHVPDLNDFVGGLHDLVADDGLITMEFPHLIRLMESNQFDTIYHEHFSYFSFSTVDRVFAHHGLLIFDVEEIPTHGGSLRIYAARAKTSGRSRSSRAAELLERERRLGAGSIRFYASFDEQVRETKRALLEFLIAAKRERKRVVGYGAPGKGNTLLNYCAIRQDFLDYTVDRNPRKQGTYTPGTRIPIYDPAVIDDTKPDYILILPWNLEREIVSSMAHVREWGCRFVVPIPTVRVVD